MNIVELVRESMPAPGQLVVEDVDHLEDVVVVRVSSTAPGTCYEPGVSGRSEPVARPAGC
jgi:hypothetical protein